MFFFRTMDSGERASKDLHHVHVHIAVGGHIPVHGDGGVDDHEGQGRAAGLSTL